MKASPELVWLPVDNGVDASLRLTWKVESETERPVGQWVTFIDAATEVINIHEVRFLSGTLTQQHHERHPGSALVSVPRQINGCTPMKMRRIPILLASSS